MITVYDTACGSLNMGDEIIMDAVMMHLESLFSHEQFCRYPTHYALAAKTLKKAWQNQLAFVGGTNLLRNYWRFRARKNQWSIGFFDGFKMQPAILMGAGWNSYAEKPEWKAKVFYNHALSKQYLHSVRDQYTLEKLKACGIENVINTGCPTLWQLTPEHLKQIPSQKAQSVVFTLTDYSRDIQADVQLVQCLKEHYSSLYFWAQGSEDNQYFDQLAEQHPELFNGIVRIATNLTAYNTLLKDHDIDFIGTRLHAGIRALQLKKRVIIIGIDNRALEMHKDFNLPVVERHDLTLLKQRINMQWQPEIHLPFDAIAHWKSQFVN